MKTTEYPDAPSILREIAPAIKERGVAKVAVAADISTACLWHWLNGTRNPDSLAIIRRVADAAGYDLRVTLRKRARAKS